MEKMINKQELVPCCAEGRSPIKDALARAREAEVAGCSLQACDMYEKIIDQISELLESEKCVAKINIHRRHLDKIFRRVHELREQFNYHNRHGRLQDQIFIKDGDVDMDYDKIFGKYMNDNVREILVYAPQFARQSHIKNFMHFLELAIKRCKNLKYLRLTTVSADRDSHHQYETLLHIGACLAQKEVKFTFRFMDELSEHMIILSNGFIFQCEYGLNYFQGCDAFFRLGICDYDFRKCLKCSFMIWRTSPYSLLVPSKIIH